LYILCCSFGWATYIYSFWTFNQGVHQPNQEKLSIFFFLFTREWKHITMDFYGNQSGSSFRLLKVSSYTIKMHLKNLPKMPQNTKNINIQSKVNFAMQGKSSHNPKIMIMNFLLTVELKNMPTTLDHSKLKHRNT